jgi:hypothetical protein
MDDDPRRCDMAEPRRPDGGGGYGRRWKKWLAIYLVAGVLIYGVVYLLLRSGSGSGGLYG